MEQSAIWLTWAPESENVITVRGWRMALRSAAGSAPPIGCMKNWSNPDSRARSSTSSTGSTPRAAAISATVWFGGTGRSMTNMRS